MSNLVDELRAVNARYEELLEASEREGGERREIEEQTMIWRKKYEAAKTELRNIKGQSSSVYSPSTLLTTGYASSYLATLCWIDDQNRRRSSTCFVRWSHRRRPRLRLPNLDR